MMHTETITPEHNKLHNGMYILIKQIVPTEKLKTQTN